MSYARDFKEYLHAFLRGPTEVLVVNPSRFHTGVATREAQKAAVVLVDSAWCQASNKLFDDVTYQSAFHPISLPKDSALKREDNHTCSEIDTMILL